MICGNGSVSERFIRHNRCAVARVILGVVKIARTIVLVLVFLAVPFLICAPFTLSQSGITIRGQVKDVTGSIVPGALVRLYSVERVLDLKSGYDGEFAFANIAKGKYELEASYPGFITKILAVEITEKVPESFSIKLDVGSGGHCMVVGLPAGVTWVQGAISYEKRSSQMDLVGLVSDQFGSPLSAVTVKLVREGASHATVSNEKGEFAFTGLEPGKYSLQSTYKGYGDHPSSVWITRENLTKAVVALVDRNRFCFE